MFQTITVHKRRLGRWGRFTEVQKAALSGFCTIVGRHTSTAQTGIIRLTDTQRKGHRHSCIDCVAALGQNVKSNTRPFVFQGDNCAAFALSSAQVILIRPVFIPGPILCRDFDVCSCRCGINRRRSRCTSAQQTAKTAG